MGRRPIGFRAMTGSDRRRKFEKTHYHDPIVEYQTTIAEQRQKIRALDEQLANIRAVQDNSPNKELDKTEILQLTAEKNALRQVVKRLKSRLNED